MLVDILKKLIRQEDLTPDEASYAMTSIMTGEAGDVRTAAMLTALSIKGETADEIESFARSMRHAAVSWDDPHAGDMVELVGTGGDSLNTINISTISSLLLASMGLPVAKHGNRAVTSTTGSADLLEESGVKLDMNHEDVKECLKEVGITFLFAQMWHPAMKHAAPVRKAMGVRTVFNILGPLTNPAPVTYQLVGVFSADYLHKIGSALAGMGRKGAYVVHSADGLDEVSPSANTAYVHVEKGKVKGEGHFSPGDFGFDPVSLDSILVKSREEAIERSKRILSGNGTHEENMTIAMNAGLVYSMVSGGDIKSSAATCMEALKSGKGALTLEKWSRFRNTDETEISIGN